MNTVPVPTMDPVGYAVSTGCSGQRGATAKTDDSLLSRLSAGDEAAFDELVNKHHGALIRLAMGYVGNRDVAEEVVQDTWMAVVQNLSRFEARSSLRTWIFGIVIHKAKDRGIREKRHLAFSAFQSCEDDFADTLDPSCFQQSGEWAGQWSVPPQPWDEQTPERLLATQQTIHAMNSAIESLPTILKEVLILRDIEGMDSEEACALLKITETNLYVRLHRARERVRKMLEAHLQSTERQV